MEIFKLTLTQMLMMFTLILAGFILRKKMLLPENAGAVMAKLETYIFVPGLSLYTMLTKCNVKTFAENYTLILCGLAVIAGALILAYPLSSLFVRKPQTSAESYRKNIFTYALTFGNFGFMGNFIILGIWGEDMFFKYSMFTFLISIVCNSWGLYVLIPKEQNSSLAQNLKKGLITPPIIAIVSGIILGLLGAVNYLPSFAVSALENASKCQGHVAMVLAGFVIGGYNFKKMLTNGKVYLTTLFRLIIIPSIFIAVLKLFGASEEIIIFTLVCFATPIGLNSIVFPAAYGGDTETGASMAMVSHTFSVITIPLMYLLFIVLL